MADIWFYEDRDQWCADVTDPETGKRKRFYLGPDENKARRKFHQRMAELHGAGRERAQSAATLADVARAWLKWSKTNCSPKTVRWRRTYLNWLLESCGDRQATDIRPADVEAVKAAHSENAPTSINHFVSCVKGLYAWAMKQGHIEQSPVEHVQRVPNGAPKKRALSPELVRQWIELAEDSPPLDDFLRLLFYTGMRRTEAADLTWDQYDAGRGILEIEDHKTANVTGRAKLIPLTDKAVEVLERQPRVAEWLWTDEDGGHITGEAFYQRWKRIRRRLRKRNGDGSIPGLEHVSFHALRHTFVSEMARRGVPRAHVEKLVGDTSQVLQRYYTDLPADTLRQSASVLDDEV